MKRSVRLLIVLALCWTLATDAVAHAQDESADPFLACKASDLESNSNAVKKYNKEVEDYNEDVEEYNNNLDTLLSPYYEALVQYYNREIDERPEKPEVPPFGGVAPNFEETARGLKCRTDTGAVPINRVVIPYPIDPVTEEPLDRNMCCTATIPLHWPEPEPEPG